MNAHLRHIRGVLDECLTGRLAINKEAAADAADRLAQRQDVLPG
jgi:hypothetical protein